VYLHGPSEGWIAIGLIVGTYLNWRLVAARLRVYTEQTGTLTLPAFLARRFGDRTGLIQGLAAGLIVLFFTIYSASGMVATGRLLESVFGLPYRWAVLLGGGVVIAYTFLGGYLAVCWTDLFQGMLIIVTLVLLPFFAFQKAGGVEGIMSAMAARNLNPGLIPIGKGLPVLAVLSSAAWGLGYFGQPHILARFMSIRSVGELRRSIRIAMVWVTIALSAAVIIGLIGIGLFADLPTGGHEKVTIYLIQEVTSRYVQGILLAAILAAIMSTIDSQLLVSASSLSEDIYCRFFRRDSGLRYVGLVSRISVICIAIVAIILAMPKDSLILQIVAYAWAGFGATFGPVILFALFCRDTTYPAVCAGMVAGAATVIIWRNCGLGTIMYEIVPGFLANCLLIGLINLFCKQKDPEILDTFDQVTRMVRNKRDSKPQPTSQVV
jgi:sodium/proline symporter